MSDDGTLLERYEDWYSQDESHWEDAPGKAVLVELLRREMPPDQPVKLLDIACGTGTLLARIAREVSPSWELHGVDFASAAVDRAAGRRPRLHLVRGDATHLGYRSDAFAVVTCYGSWEHFEDPPRAIAEAARVLEPGGWVLAMLPTLGIYRTDRDDEGWYEDVAVAGEPARQLQWNWRRETWARHFAAAGFDLDDGDLARECGAHKPGVFFLGRLR